MAGSVDITVTMGDKVTLFDAFNYTDDSSENTGGNTGGGTDTGGNGGNTGGNTGNENTNNSGLVSGLGSRRSVVDPLISPSGTTPMVSGSVTLHAPTGSSWLSWLPATGTVFPRSIRPH